MTSVPAEIFKAYDIRGIVGSTLTPEIVTAIGQALGTEARARAQTAVAIGRDGRLSGPELSAALARGLCAAGVDVIAIGMAATPMGYFAAHPLAAAAWSCYGQPQSPRLQRPENGARRGYAFGR